MQARDGLFAHEIRAHGSYSSWVATHPYDREPWLTFRRKSNVYHTSRLRFAANWLGQSAVCHNNMLIVEMYPLHSTAVTGAMRPPAKIIDRFVWLPAAEIDTEYMFAFGRRWAA
jgi:hypothetical protein